MTAPDAQKPDFSKTGYSHAIQIPPVIYELHITNDFAIHCTTPPPNAFHRFFMRVLLGWRFEIR